MFVAVAVSVPLNGVLLMVIAGQWVAQQRLERAADLDRQAISSLVNQFAEHWRIHDAWPEPGRVRDDSLHVYVDTRAAGGYRIDRYRVSDENRVAVNLYPDGRLWITAD